MRTWILVLMAALMFAVAGCVRSQHQAIHRAPQLTSPPAGHRADLAAALLFDRQPGRYRASDFVSRSDWPSTHSFYSPGQVIYFTERFVNFQGRQLGESDHTYRRFDTYRAGVGYR